MALDKKYQQKYAHMLRDTRLWHERFIDGAETPWMVSTVYGCAVFLMFQYEISAQFSDVIFLGCFFYYRWLKKRPLKLPFKLPKSAKCKDPNFKRPDGSTGMADGILYLGNDADTGEEVWFTNSDARTHCLYLGTTGSGKTFGLKSYACNALTWASGFIFIDGKADTDLWSTLSAMARRFGRDDDLLLMNYMTGNTTGRVASNTLNPFSAGSSSYLTNMLVSLMPDSEGDNAMWKDRAVALVSALMPCLVWKRENQNIPLSIAVIRQYLTFKAVIKLSRDKAVPEHLRSSVQAYLAELPGYVDNVFDDNGDEKPPSASVPATDTSVPRQQHGYLSMQFTRSMQSLGDDYGFIFDTQAADIDMMDVVLNRRILVVLIPALEKSGDETANLGKIISSTLKGMMGSTLGNSVEGESATAIENKPTNSSTPFIAIFDEVGYYTAQGMAVMAAQARSLGFSLVFAGQDLPALEKRVKEEARSITANCNIKLFGKLEDPGSTKEFFEKTVGKSLVSEVSGFQAAPSGYSFVAGNSVSVQARDRGDYGALKGYNEGKAVCSFGKDVQDIQIYNSDIGHAKVMRVHRFLPITPPSEDALESLKTVDAVLKRLRNPRWRPEATQTQPHKDIEALAQGYQMAKDAGAGPIQKAAVAIAAVAVAHGTMTEERARAEESGMGTSLVSAQAEAEAAAKVAESTKTGPLSWGEIIGGDTPAVEKKKAPLPKKIVQKASPEAEAEAAQKVDNPLSWLDVIGAAPVQERKADELSAPAEEDVQEDVADLDIAGFEGITAGGDVKTVPQPMSWADVIGKADEKD